MRPSAGELIDLVLDDGSWVSWDRPPAREGASADYLAELAGQGATTAELAPILEILPLQRLAHTMALARGVDPDAPRGLNRVTETW